MKSTSHSDDSGMIESRVPCNRHGATTATLLTSSVPAAIAVIEVHGPDALAMVLRHWTPHRGSPELAIHTLRYGSFRTHIVGSQNNAPEQPGESIVVHRSEVDRIELHCHGGVMAAGAIQKTLQSLGAILTTPSQWIDRNIDDPIAREATEDLLQATTLTTARILLDQQRGALSKAFETIEKQLLALQWPVALKTIDAVLGWSDVGLHLIRPWRVVLCGPPNVGKSSLLNRLLGYARAIVHDEPGTTRDLLAETTSIEGWPVELIDSAGVRSATDMIEREGIARARTAIDAADLLLLLVDPVAGWTDEQEAISRAHAYKYLVVRTKCDMATRAFLPPAADLLAIEVSAATGQGIDHLLEQIASWFVPDPPGLGQAVPFRSRHVGQLQRWKSQCLDAID
jgi:tRNA modification GTPase